MSLFVPPVVTALVPVLGWMENLFASSFAGTYVPFLSYIEIAVNAFLSLFISLHALDSVRYAYSWINGDHSKQTSLISSLVPNWFSIFSGSTSGSRHSPALGHYNIMNDVMQPDMQGSMMFASFVLNFIDNARKQYEDSIVPSDDTHVSLDQHGRSGSLATGRSSSYPITQNYQQQPYHITQNYQQQPRATNQYNQQRNNMNGNYYLYQRRHDDAPVTHSRKYHQV